MTVYNCRDYEHHTLKYALANYGALGHVPSQVLEILCILQLLQLNCKISKIAKENMCYIVVHLAVSVLGNRNMNAVSKHGASLRKQMSGFRFLLNPDFCVLQIK